MKQQRILAALSLTFCLSACINPGIVEVTPGQYLIARRDPGGMIGNTAALKASIIKKANDFAKEQGKVAVPVPLHETPGWPNCDPLLVEYHFRVVDPTQAAAPPATKPHDVPTLSANIVQLDELRKRGLLTQIEFDEQKQKLLQAK
jgi:hypothetical protein